MCGVDGQRGTTNTHHTHTTHPLPTTHHTPTPHHTPSQQGGYAKGASAYLCAAHGHGRCGGAQCLSTRELLAAGCGLAPSSYPPTHPAVPTTHTTPTTQQMATQGAKRRLTWGYHRDTIGLRCVSLQMCSPLGSWGAIGSGNCSHRTVMATTQLANMSHMPSMRNHIVRNFRSLVRSVT